jgi:hypothetical protein
VARDEGVRGLWAGVTASCIRTAAGAGLYFLLLERVTRELDARQGLSLLHFSAACEYLSRFVMAAFMLAATQNGSG